MEAICSSETYVDFQRATQRYIPEYGPEDTMKWDALQKWFNVYLITLRAPVTVQDSCPT
jgi:hypothetical protein